MPNCRKAATHLAYAWLSCDKIKDLANQPEPGTQPALNIGYLQIEVENLESYLEAFYKEIGRRPFEGAPHDLANLKNQAERAPDFDPGFLHRYAEDLQKEMINQGLLDIIDCQHKFQ